MTGKTESEDVVRGLEVLDDILKSIPAEGHAGERPEKRDDVLRPRRRKRLRT